MKEEKKRKNETKFKKEKTKLYEICEKLLEKVIVNRMAEFVDVY
jgi:hypothetical protein